MPTHPKIDLANRRNQTLDIIRGVTIILMIVAHCIDYFYSGNSLGLQVLADWIKAVAFTTFLFVSGAALWISALDKLDTAAEEYYVRRKLFKRGVQLLLVYYFVGLFAWAPQLFSNFTPQWDLLWKFLSLQALPGLLEFILAFAGYTFLAGALPRQLRAIGQNTLLAMVVALSSLALGGFLAQTANLDGIVGSWGRLLYGSENGYYFPLLQYGLVWLLGQQFGRILADGKETVSELYREALSAIILSGVTFLTVMLVGEAEFAKRFPPSIAFLAFGLAWVILVYLLLGRFSFTARLSKRIYSYLPSLQFVSRNALAIFTAHVVVVYGFSHLAMTRVTDGLQLLLVIIGVFALSIWATRLWQLLAVRYGQVQLAKLYATAAGILALAVVVIGALSLAL